MPDALLVLEWAAAWHCTPSEVLEEPFEPRLITIANEWGVKPSRVLEEDIMWVQRQELVDKLRAKAKK